MKFLFYADESYDGNPSLPTSITISGFLSDEISWAEVRDEWNEVNNRYGVPCFHATALNSGRDKYAGWPKSRRDQYSAELLDVVNRQGKRLVAYNCGMRADALASFTFPMQTAQAVDLHRYNNHSCYYILSQHETMARWLNHLVQTRGGRAQHRVKCSVEL